MGGKRNSQGGRQFECGLIEKPYEISRYPVTVAQYQAFVDDKGYEEERFWTKEGWNWRVDETVTEPQAFDAVFQTPNHPRVGVSWFEAAAFCRWLSEKLGTKPGAGALRLPSEAEWERTARGTKGHTYPWGDDDPTEEHCNWGKSGIGYTSAVGMFPKGRAECGASDLAGNVWEWCATRWIGDYKDYEQSVDNSDEGKTSRVVRGGSWYNYNPESLLCSNRFNLRPDVRLNDIGFRCVREATSR